MFQFPLFLFHLQILDMDLDPDDQEMYSGEEGNTQSSFYLISDQLITCMFILVISW